MFPPLITLEEHYVSDRVKGAFEHYNGFRPEVVEKLQSLGEGRLKEMDAGKGYVLREHLHVDIQAKLTTTKVKPLSKRSSHVL